MDQPKRPPLKLIGVKQGERPPLTLVGASTDEEKKSLVGNGVESGLPPLSTGSNPFQSSQVDTQAPTVLIPEKQKEYVQNQQKERKVLSDQLNVAQGAFRTAQGEEVLEEIQSFNPNQTPVREPEKPIGFAESVGNTVNNIGVGLQQFIPNTAIALGGTLETVFGKDVGGDVYAQITRGGSPDSHRMEAYAKLEELEPKFKQTRGLIEAGKRFDVVGLAAASIDAVGSLVRTAVTSVPTAGFGLYSDMVGSSVANYNKQKARSLGITVNELYEIGENDFVLPATIGGVGAQLERIGLKGVQNAINKQLVGSASKKIATFMTDVNKEGLTEWLQTGLEKGNTSVASGKDAVSAGEDAVKEMFSKKGLEAYLMGVVGSGGAAGLGRLAQTATSPKAKESITQDIETLNRLNDEIINPDATPESKAFVETQIRSTVGKIAKEVDNDIEAVEQLGAQQKQDIVNLGYRIRQNNAVINDPAISPETKALAEEQNVTLNKELESKLSEKPKKTQLDEDIKDVDEVISEEVPVVSDQNSTVVSAVIEIGGKIYEGKNHAEAILKAKADGQDISQVNRQAQGKFKLSDGTIIDRAESKKRFGQDRSELMIEQDELADNANKEYRKITDAKTDVATQEQVEVSPQEETIVSKPKIVVHATEGDAGFALSQFEGVDTKDIVTPDEDYRNSAEFKNGKTLLVDSTVDDSGAINVRIAAGMSDVGGRAGSAVYDIVIPKGSTATTQVINDIIQSEHNKPREKGDRSLIKRTTKLIKEYIDSRQPETKTNEQETQTKGEDKRPVTATGSDTAVTEEVGSGVVVDKTPEQNITDISKETGLQFTKSKNSNSWYSSDGNKKIRISDHPSKFVEKSKEFNGDDAIDLDYNYYSKDAIVHLIKGTNPFENYKIGDKIIHSNNKIGEVEYLNSDYKKGYVEVLTQDGRTVKYDTGKFLSKENNLQNPKQSLPTQEVAPPKLSLDFIDEVKIPKNGIKRDILGTRGKNKGKVIDTEIVSKDDLIKEHNAIREKENKLKKLIACLTK